MASAVTPTDVVESGIPGLDVMACTVVTGTNGEDGVTFNAGMRSIRQVFVCGSEAAKSGPFFATWSGDTVTVSALAGTEGDTATVSVLILGIRG